MIDVAKAVFYIFFVINALIALSKIWDKIIHKCSIVYGFKSAYCHLASIIYCKGKFVGTLVLWAVSLLIIAYPLSVNTDLFTERFDTVRHSSQYFTAKVYFNGDTYYCPAEIVFESDEVDTGDERTEHITTACLTKIVISEKNVYTPYEPLEIDVGSSKCNTFIDSKGKEKEIEYTILDDVLPYKDKPIKHDYILEIQALYMLICIYALSAVQRFSLEDITHPHVAFGCSLQEKLWKMEHENVKVKTKEDIDSTSAKNFYKNF